MYRIALITTLMLALVPAVASASWNETRREAQRNTRHQVSTAYDVNQPVSAYCRLSGASWDAPTLGLYFQAHRWVCAWAAESDTCSGDDRLFGILVIKGSTDPTRFFYSTATGARCVS